MAIHQNLSRSIPERKGDIMKKIYILIAIAIVGILGCSATINATENIIDLGTIEYSNIHEKTLVVKINSSEFVDLRYISSDIDKSSLYIFNCWFSPLENVTNYVFATTQKEKVDWWFINDTKTFIYQDNGIYQLYSVNIDYSAIQVPPDPLIEWMAKYDILVNSSNELEILLNATLNELNASRNELMERWNAFNQSQEDFDNNSIAMIAMEKELKDLNIKYNNTEALWISATSNASTYESSWRALGGEYDDLQKDYDNLSGIWPIWMFFAVLGTGIVVILILKRKKIFNREEPTAQKIEIDTGYDQKATAIDKFTSGIGKVVEKVTPKQRRKEKDAVPGLKPAESEVDIQNIHKKIDGFRSAHDEFQKTIVKDVRGVETRVDTIETKLEIKK